MSDTQTVSVNARFDWAALLGVAFVILKLTGVIAWSWWWVLAPFWIPVVLALLVIGFIFLVAALP